ncbi:MAG: hypothetical protein ACK58T_01975, partial [Phycisphaerae bacterium]
MTLAPLQTAADGADKLTLAEAAADLRTTVAKLRRLHARGQFPALLEVTRKHALVLRADFEAWKAGRWRRNDPEREAIVLDAVRGTVRNR